MSPGLIHVRYSFLLVGIFLLSILAPLATAATVESQFDDGSTSYSHTFNGQGVGTAGSLTIPYGAEVTNAQFNLRGSPSTFTYSNLSSDANFGGAGGGTWQQQPPPGLGYGYRTGVEVEDGNVSLLTVPTDKTSSLASTSHISNLNGAHHNTSGQFVSLSDIGHYSPTMNPTSRTLVNGSWSYPGPVVNLGNDTHILMWSSSSIYTAPTAYRYDTDSGEYEGMSSLNYGNCTSSVANYIYDATGDGTDTAWTVSYSYRYIAKWSISNTGVWTCDQYWTVSGTYYPSGISVDSETDELYIYMYQQQFPNYYHYLWQVDRAFPNSWNQSWSLGSGANLKGNPAGLAVEGSRATINTYQSNMAEHHFYEIDGMFANRLGAYTFSNQGHYGLENLQDGTLGYTCYYSSYCTGKTRKLLRAGSGVTFEPRQVSQTSAEVLGQMTTITSPIDEITLSSAVVYTPGNTSAEFELSVDGGTTWMRASLGQTLTFAQAGTQLVAKVYLNGTSTETPVLDLITLTYVSSYQSNGYFYVRSNYNSLNPVAATIWWNATTPGGSYIDVRVDYGGQTTWSNSGDTNSFSGTSTYIYVYVYLYSGSGNSYTPIVHDLNITFHTNAPQQVGLDIGADGTKEWSKNTVFIGTETATGQGLVNAFNTLIPNSGTGTVNIPIEVSSGTSGIMSIESFSVTYTMATVNLDITYEPDEILHERSEWYEVVTRHVIGETATRIETASLQFNAMPLGMAPLLEWNTADSQPTENDPENWISIDPSSWMNESNGILEVHWRFKVYSEFPEQSNVRFTAKCTDDNDRTPTNLPGTDPLVVNHSYGLGWMKVLDNDGMVTWSDIPDNSWVAAGETIHFQGQMHFLNTEDAPKDNAFDVRVAQGSFVHSSWRDLSNTNGSFFVSIDVPTIDVVDGVTYEVQTYNEQDPTRVLPIDTAWRRTFRIDATSPEALEHAPLEGDYEAADEEHQVSFRVADAVGSPVELSLNYWIEAIHDDNRNGEADPEEYAIKPMLNSSEGADKWFFTDIDDSMNPNMARVSYFVTGSDPAGNALRYNAGETDDGDIIWLQYEAGFDKDTATFITRKDSIAVFTGLSWDGHYDDGVVFSGTQQSISLGLIDANTVIDFEHISLIFDFEGPNPVKDQQVISFSGLNNTFWSESEYITLSSASTVETTINQTGMPWIQVNFVFEFSWDWPDEEYGDLALQFKERGSEFDTRIEFSDHTFRVENDLVLAPMDFLIRDTTEPRTGPIADGSRVRSDDRLSFTGRVVYEGSNTPAPRSLGIQIDVFDGVSVWSDGSLEEDGGYNVEVALSAATGLASAETRVCLISISGIPGHGEDMTGNTVATTLRVVVDHSPPRVTHRSQPIDVIDISSASDLTKVPVTFSGTEDADLTGSEQFVNWVMRDHTNTITIASGINRLGMQQDGQSIIWTGTVDLTADGIVAPRQGDLVGFWITGYDAAGNPFLEVGNSPANPIPELSSVDGDFELNWVRLGAQVAELSIVDLSVSDDHLSDGERVEITATIINTGGNTSTAFSVAFMAGPSERPFHTSTITGIDEGETITLTAVWESEEGIDRVRVIVDPENVIIEVNEDDNRAEHSVEVVYPALFGWLDSPREDPLVWIFMLFSVLIVSIVFAVAQRTSLNQREGSLFDDEEYEDDDFDDEYDDAVFDDMEDDFDDDEDDDY